MSPIRPLEYEQSAILMKALDKGGKRVGGTAFEVTFPGANETEIIVVDQHAIIASEAGLAAILAWLNRVSQLIDGEGLFVTESNPVGHSLDTIFNPEDPRETRICNSLKRAGIETVEMLREEVQKLGGLEELQIRNIGEKSKGLLAKVLKVS